MITGKRFFQIYLATRLHFTTEYDAFKFKGQVPNLDARYAGLKNGSMLFEKWGSKVRDHAHAATISLCNQLLCGPRWVYDMTVDDAVSIYNEWSKTHDAITYHTTEDFTFIRSLFEKEKLKVYDDLLQKTKNGHAPLLQLYMANRVLPDTIVALDVFRPSFLDSWVTEYEHDPAVRERVQSLVKYKPYVTSNLPKIRESYKTVFSTPKKEK